MIRNIVLDMGNVLLTYNPQVPLDLYCGSEEEKTMIRKELFDGPEWVQGDLGHMDYEEKFASIRRRVPERMHPALKRCIWEWDVCMKPVEGAREFCDDARRKGFGLYVLSNAATDFYRYFPRFLPPEYFDGIVVSADVHVVKPDERIYRHLLKTYGLNPDECLFIDDLEQNVEGARRAGMSGAVFRGDFKEIWEICAG